MPMKRTHHSNQRAILMAARARGARMPGYNWCTPINIAIARAADPWDVDNVATRVLNILPILRPRMSAWGYYRGSSIGAVRRVMGNPGDVTRHPRITVAAWARDLDAPDGARFVLSTTSHTAAAVVRDGVVTVFNAGARKRVAAATRIA